MLEFDFAVSVATLCNDSRWAGYEQRKEMEDHDGRSGDEEDLCKNGTKAANAGQKELHVEVCLDNLEQLKTEPNLLKWVVTGYESWIFEYDSLTKRQSLEWKSTLSPRPKKARVFKSKSRWCWSLFLMCMELSTQNSCHEAKPCNQHVYKNILRRLMCSVREKRRELWETRSWLFHHDNALAHNALGIRKFRTEIKIAVLEEPPYSPNLAPCDFFLFPKLKEVIKGTHFQDSQAIKTTVTRKLWAIPEESFQDCVEAWHRRSEKCIWAQGDYFEVDML